MNILYVITKSNWGGAQRHVFDLACNMKSRGHDVAVAVGGDGILRKRLEAAGIYTHSISTLKRDISLGDEAGSIKELYSLVKHRRPDILHLHSPKAAGLGSVVGRLLRVPKIIMTVHGWPFNEDRPFNEKGLILFFSWLTMLFCHTTIVLSEREWKQALKFPYVKEKIRLIPLGIKAPTFMSVDGAKQFIAKAIGMDVGEYNKKTVVGTIAEFHKNKGLSYLIDAMEQVAIDHPQVICIVIGNGQEEAALRTLIASKKLEQKIFLAGYLEHAAEYLKAFSIFVLPSVKEGLPYAILEAGVASLPVVATAVGGIPEIIEDMKSGVLIQAKHVRELSHAISFMIEHPNERRAFGTALRERITTKFSLEKMLESVSGLYGKK